MALAFLDAQLTDDLGDTLGLALLVQDRQSVLPELTPDATAWAPTPALMFFSVFCKLPVAAESPGHTRRRRSP